MSESAKRSRKKTVPKGLSDIDKMRDFYKRRAKDPIHYVYTPEGDLRIQGLEGKPEEIIPLRYFSALTEEEREEILRQRQEEIEEVEAAYEDSLRSLREAYANYLATGQGEAAVVLANMEVRDTSILRSKAAYPSRWIADINNPTINTILLQQRYETRKLGYSAYLFKRQDMSKRNAWGRYRDAPPPAEGSMSGGSSQPIRFITTPEEKENGIFHPTSLHEFVFNETRYSSPYQAFQAERFRELENEAMRKQILGTRSSRTIKSLVQKEEQLPKDSKKLWEDIVFAMCKQTDLGAKLKETGSAKFHNMDKEFGSQDYTDALEHVRLLLLEEEAEKEAEPQAVRESVISEEQQKEAKKGAIIHNFRKRGF
jgi:predicted NAD-dependent protein-ADP-ribosyltransferase YbiA (DUF1768 family)